MAKHNDSEVIVKLKGSLPEASAIDGIRDKLYASKPGTVKAFSGEFEILETTNPKPGAHPVVRLRIISVEVPVSDEADEQLREWSRTNYAARTSDGTLEFVEHDGTVQPGPTATTRSRVKA